MAEGHGSWDSIHTKYLERADAEREDAGWPHPTLQGLEAEDGSDGLTGTGSPFRGMKTFRIYIGVMDAGHWQCTKCH